MVINTNISSQQSALLLAESSSKLAKSLNRLSSGSKIISPQDDAAGLAVSMRFDAQINRINATSNNVSNAISFSQTQDGFLQKVGKALDRMSELAVLSQDITKGDIDRNLYNMEFQKLGGYINDLARRDFNGVSLFSAAEKAVTTDSEGVNPFVLDNIQLNTGDYATATGTAIGTTTAAGAALTAVKSAIIQLATDRATVGASMARLTYTNEQLAIQKTNLASANSIIKDVDVAEESTQYARYNILVQSGTAMLAQANASPQSALRLLG